MRSALALLGLEWARPGAIWALALPLAFLLLLRLFARPRTVVIGTFALWQDEPALAPRGARMRGRPRASTLCFALALLCGAFAWLGPRPARAAAARRWTCVVDLSPSLALPLGGGTRLQAALASAEAWLAEHAGSVDRVCWSALGRETLELARGERPAAEWLAPERSATVEPDWAIHDQPGTLWITDRAPSIPRAHAGLFASGGPEVPGAIAADGRRTVLYDGLGGGLSGGALRSVPTDVPPAVRTVASDDCPWPPVLERVLQAWCEARACRRTTAPAPDAVLTLELVCGAAGAGPIELARDGWSATGVAARDGVPTARLGSGEDWLVARLAGTPGPVVVRAASGRIVVALRELAEPGGDPARFALSWSRLFDRCALPPAGVLPLAERLDAGAAVRAGGEAAAPAARGGPERGPYIDAALALAAAGCVLVGLLLRARAGGARSSIDSRAAPPSAGAPGRATASRPRAAP